MKTEAQKAARHRYKEKKLELVAFEVKKGMSAEYTAAAARIGLGKMEMIRRAIAEFIERHADGGADETQAQSAETGAKAQLEGEIPIIYSERTQTAQDAPISTNEQTIQPAADDAQNRITDTDRRLLAAVDALLPESKQTLLKFLESLQS